MKEGKSMEKAAETHCDKIKESYKTYDGTLHDWLQQNYFSFIAGWQAQNGEIERLKEIIKEFWLQLHPHTEYFGHTDGHRYNEQKRFWEMFKERSNL